MNLDKLIAWIGRLGQYSLIRNTLWMLLAQGLRLILQAVYFIIVARSLGPQQYGLIVATTSFVGIIFPFVGLGSGTLIIKNVSRNRALFGEYWGNALLMVSTSSFTLIIFAMLIAPVVLPKNIPLLLIFIVAVTDLFFFKLIDTAGQAFQAVSWLSKTAQLNILPQITRLIAAFVLINFFTKPGALEWTFLYLISTVVCALIAVILVYRSLDSPKLALSRIKPELTEGFYFSISHSAQNIYNDIDKTMLARLSTLEATGIYAAAYRLIDVAFVPVRSLSMAAFAKFFQHGSTGIGGGVYLVKRLLPIAGSYGAAAGIGLFIFAPVVPYVLGDEYGDAVEALRWLAPLPFIKAMHYFAADTLTGSGFQSVRTAVQLAVAVSNILINLWLIPLYSWRGAAWSSLVSDGFLMVGIWMMVAFFNWKQNKKIKDNK